MVQKIFLLAGEVSGDKLGAELISALTSLYPKAEVFGIGGQKMAAEGLHSTEDMSQLSIMGIGEVLSAYGRLHALADRLVAEVIKTKPDIVFTIDSKAFSVRFAKKLRAEMKRCNWSAPIIHMVAPTIWAWGSWRRHAFETVFDGLLCLFPFEPDLFNKSKIEARFIGHPSGFDSKIDSASRQENLVGLLPGSRGSEIRYILPDMLDAAEVIFEKRPDVRFILPALPHLLSRIKAQTDKRHLPIEIISGGEALQTVLASASACIAASGTVSLELALNAMPTTTCYKVSWLNYLFMRSLYRLKDPILPHILLGHTIYPYFEQSQQIGDKLAQSMLDILDDLPAETAKLKTASATLTDMLTGEGASYQMQLQSALRSLLHLK